jgi:protoheme IX farnesyltransferase
MRATGVGCWITLFKLRIASLITFTGVAAAVLAAPGWPAAETLGLLALTLMLASASAGALNNVMDADIDTRMGRTQGRPLPSGRIGRGLVVNVALALMVVALGVAWLGMNRVVALHLFGGAFVYVVVYTAWLKRRSALNIVIGGLAGSFAVLAGAAAVDPMPQVVPTVLAIVLFLWTPPHFWSLAAAKGKDYAHAGVPMLPIVVPAHAWTLAILTHTVVLVAISLVPLWFGMGLAYGLGAGIGGAIFLWKSVSLYWRPTQNAAIANFLASLLQLTLLISGVLLDGAIGSWS